MPRQFEMTAQGKASLEEKLRKNSFNLEDFKGQLKQLRSMGPLGEIASLIPGMQKLKGIDFDEKRLTRVEAIINSMTLDERRRPQLLNASRRKRIALGSGTKVQDVNQLMKQFQMMKKMMKQVGGMSKRRMMKNLPMGL